MKKLLCLLLFAAMVLGLLCACGVQEEPPATVAPVEAFSVGYGCSDISPKEVVPLVSCGNTEPTLSSRVSEPLTLICLAFSDSRGKTVLFMTADLLLAHEGIVSDLSAYVAKKTGVRADHILFHATHSPSAPAIEMAGTPAIDTYNAGLKEAAVQASLDALMDRKPSQMFTTFCRPEGYNTVRHYLLSDGTYLGEGVNEISPNRLIGHTAPADNLMQLVKFTREGGTDIVLVNWQGHSENLLPESHIAASSGYAGVLRATLETELDCHPVFILGGSGNIDNGSYIDGETKAGTYQELGTMLAAEAIEAASGFQSAAISSIHLEENRLALTDNNKQQIIAPLHTLSIGDFAMVTAPFEIFDTNAVAVREASSFKITFFASCTNGSNGFLPTPQAFEFDSYEARITRFPIDTPQIVQEALNDMLSSSFEKSGNKKVKKDEGYNTPEFTPTCDGITYINPTPGVLTEVRAVENGYYALRLSDGTRIRNMLINSKTLAEQIIGMMAMQLIFNQSNVVVGIVE